MNTLGSYTLRFPSGTDPRFASLHPREFLPLVIGGMGVNISTKELAYAASALGAIGHVSDAMILSVCDRELGSKFRSKKTKVSRALNIVQDRQADIERTVCAPFDAHDVHQAAQLYASAVMSGKPGDGLVFVNVMEKLSMGAGNDTLRARLCGALDGGIDGITLSAGLHTNSMALMQEHPRFRDALIGIIVSSARALKIFLRSAKRVNRLPDYVVVEGPLAGGHLGFGKDWESYDLATLTKEVVEFLASEALTIPVIPAGGIFSGSDASAMINLGAAAVQVATRFTITKESGLPERAKHAYISASSKDVVVNSVSPTGYLMRMLTTSPCLTSAVRPCCEGLGYMLSDKGECSYRDAYMDAPAGLSGRKLAVTDKICICHHFSSHQCYTCGHNVFRLKDTLQRDQDGNYSLPAAHDVLLDYLMN